MKNANRIERQSSRVEWVPLVKMRVRTDVAQREFRQSWANEIARDFKLEKFDMPVVNKVGDWYWIIDGQHSTAALKQWIGDWEAQSIECRVYRDLSEKQEADIFLSLNNVKAVKTFDKFRIGLTAGRAEPTAIATIVERKGLRIVKNGGERAVSCVGTLSRIHRKGADCLSRALGIAYEAFGDEGLESDILEGMGSLVGRYDGALQDAHAIEQLSNLRGGANGLRSRGERLRQQTGVARSQCIAAAAVEIINRGKGGKKLPGWFKSEDMA